MGKTISIAVTLAGLLLLVSPDAVFRALGWQPGLSAEMSRVVGAALAFGGFFLLRRASKSAKDETVQPPPIPVDNLLSALQASHPQLVAQTGSEDALREILGHLARRKKIDAIKALRAATGQGLKESKELVEEIQSALPKPG